MGVKSKKGTNGSLGMQWFTTGISTTLVLILLGVVSFFVLFARRLSDSVKENLTVTVLLNGDAGNSDIRAFQTSLRAERYVYALDYVSKEQALKEQAEAMGSDPSEFLGANPFTASFELRMNALYANSDSLTWITAELRKSPLVEDVIYQKELVDTVNDNLRHASYVLLCLAVLLALVSFALINSTVRLSIHSGRFVIRTMLLVGASWRFIRKPFMARSFNLGFLSGVLADAVLWGGVRAFLRYDPSLSQYVGTDMLVAVGAAVLLFGLLLTLGCTYVSVGRYLRTRSDDLY